MLSFRTRIALVTLAAVTLCPFNCLRHKAARANYLAELARQTQADRLLPPAPPRCQNETGCICQGAIFVAAPEVHDAGAQLWDDVCLIVPAVACDASSIATFDARSPAEMPCSAPSGRMLRALISSLQI